MPRTLRNSPALLTSHPKSGPTTADNKNGNFTRTSKCPHHAGDVDGIAAEAVTYMNSLPAGVITRASIAMTVSAPRGKIRGYSRAHFRWGNSMAHARCRYIFSLFVQEAGVYAFRTQPLARRRQRREYRSGSTVKEDGTKVPGQ
jgi:hypothetical protein